MDASKFDAWIADVIKIISTGDFKSLQGKKVGLILFKPFIAQHDFEFWSAYIDGLLAWQVDHQPYAAQPFLKQAYEMGHKVNPIHHIRVCMAWEIWHVESGQFDQALKINSDTQVLAEKHAPEAIKAGILINRARIHWRLGDLVAAQHSLDSALLLLSGLNHPYKARGYNTQGMVYLQKKSFSQAKTSFENALNAAKASKSTGPETDALCNLGYLAYLYQEWGKAERYLHLARALAIDANDILAHGEIEMYLGAIALKLGQISHAELSFEIAKNKFQTAQVGAYLPELHLHIADLHETKSNFADALRETQQAIVYAEDLIGKVKDFSQHHKFTDASLLAYEQFARRLFQQNADKNLSDIYYYLERSKSRILNEMLAARQLRRPDDVAAVDFDREQLLAQRYYLSLGLPPADQDSVERTIALKKELDTLRERLALGSATYRSKTITPYQLASIQAKMPSNSVLLEYFSLRDQFYLFVVTPQHAELIDLALTRDDIESQILKHNGRWLLQDIFPNASDHLNAPLAQARLQEWGENFLSPAAKWLANADLVCIVPHDLLHYFPLHALPINNLSSDEAIHDSDRCLANGTRRVVYAPSAALLFGYCQEKSDSPYPGMLAAGNNQATQIQDKKLHHAETIAQLVAGMFGQHSRLLIGQAATQAAIIEFANRYRYLLFACHGQFDPNNPLESSLTLADHPLKVDHILRDLACHADLVVLSACETGVSHVLKGDELIGFARAFLYAGARSLLMTLWKVDEFSTRLLMEKFFDELVQNIAPSLALSRAQHYLRTLTLAQLRTLASINHLIIPELDALTDSDDYCVFGHPYYWAAFYLVGEKFV